jgi:CRISPR-associated endoribonuclease Cas6
MRVKLTLNALSEAAELPLNYQSSVAAMIYGALNQSSPDYAVGVHDFGYQTEGQTFRLFTFSRLHTRAASVRANKLALQDRSVTLQVSSPAPIFIQHLIAGLSHQPALHIGEAGFELTHTELIPPPIFRGQMAFRALSPITESVNGHEKHATFLGLTDDWSRVIGNNLTRKYRAFHGHDPKDQSMKWTWSESYIAKAEKQGARLSVLVDLHGIKIRGWLAPFVVEGSRELIELGYETGFGARNSMGFGMVEIDTWRT